MPADVTSVPPPSELTPFLWIAGFGLCFALHLIIHPQARIFREALRWLGRHPAPLLWLMASIMVGKAWALRAGLPMDEGGPMPAVALWPDAFLMCLDEGWKRFVMLFHQAVLPPPVLPGSWAGAMIQGLISATGQMWLACYLTASLKPVVEDAAALRRTGGRWRMILALSLCHAPWWWLQWRSDMDLARDWLMPEFLLFLAPLPLTAAMGRVDFMEAGAEALRWWRQSWGQMLVFALTALPLLALLEYCLRLLPGIMPASEMLARVLLESVLASAVQMWLFVTAALLLLRGGYLSSDTADD